jgi:hypothetical protein
MDNKILHIGLQIIEEDIQNFYLEILNCSVERTFVLSKEDANSIFNIPKAAKVVYVKCGNIELELFVEHVVKKPIFNHICLVSSNLNEMVSKAKTLGFYTYVRIKKDNTKTYFLRDSNNNVFELKESEKIMI